MRRGLHHGISLETSVSDFSGRRQARSVVGDRRRRRNLHFGIVQRPAIRHAAQGAQERRQIGQARDFRRTDSCSRGTRPSWCDHGCGAGKTEPRVDYSGAWRYRHVGQRILLRRWHRDRCLRPQGWHPNPHPANARQAQPASTRFPHQQRQCLPQPPQGMAASLPWRRDEEPAQLPWLAPYSGGLGPKDHARGFYLWSDRIRPISTINAIRATNFDLAHSLTMSQVSVTTTRPCTLLRTSKMSPSSRTWSREARASFVRGRFLSARWTRNKPASRVTSPCRHFWSAASEVAGQIRTGR